MRTKLDITGDKREQLEQLFRKRGYIDFKWIEPEEIIISQWVRMKCMSAVETTAEKPPAPQMSLYFLNTRIFFENTAMLLSFTSKKSMEA